MAYDVALSLTVRAPRERLFPLLLTPHHLARWFCNFAQVAPTVGGTFRFGGDYAIAAADPPGWECEIVAGEALRSVSFRWPLFGADTRVDWRVGDAENGCVMHVAHRGLPGEDTTSGTFHDAWRICLGNLKAIAEGRSDSLRPDSSSPRDPMKLDILVDVPIHVAFGALVEPEHVRRWVGGPRPPAVQPAVGGTYDLGGDGTSGTVRAWAPPTRLDVEWRPEGPVRSLSVSLEEKSGGRCGIYTVHTGFASADPVILKRFRGRWTESLVRLKNYLEAGDPGVLPPPAGAGGNP